MLQQPIDFNSSLQQTLQPSPSPFPPPFASIAFKVAYLTFSSSLNNPFFARVSKPFLKLSCSANALLSVFVPNPACKRTFLEDEAEEMGFLVVEVEEGGLGFGFGERISMSESVSESMMIGFNFDPSGAALDDAVEVDFFKAC